MTRLAPALTQQMGYSGQVSMDHIIHIIWFRALIWYWDHLKNFIADIPQGPLGMSIGTIWVTQKKGSRGPQPGVFDFLGFDKNITKIEIWLSYPHFLADF